MPVNPPRYAQRILLFFLRDDLAEEVLGDLDEKFFAMTKRTSLLRARLNYWYQVMHYMRPFAIRRSKPFYTNHYAMYKNYFRIGFRNLLKNKGYSAINIGGLALGMAVAMLIGLWIYDELYYDRNHENYDRIVHVRQGLTINGTKLTGYAIPRPLEDVFRSEYGSDFTYMSMASWTGPAMLSYEDKHLMKVGNYFQVDFPEIISVKMISGSRDALKDPTSLLISASTAKAFFGTEDPLNKAMRISNEMDVKVAGVYEDLPYNSSFHELDYMASWDLYVQKTSWVQDAATEWGNNSFQLFAQLTPQADLDVVAEKVLLSKMKHAPAEENTASPKIILHPMRHWHLRSEWKDGVNAGGRIQFVWMFAIIGSFVLLLACINFMNLSTARSEKRAKEVGIRMTVGSLRRQLINQFLSESLLVVAFAFVGAIVVVILALPWFNELADKKMILPWNNPLFWGISIVFIFCTSLLAGSYPAFFLSSFHPVKVLKGTFKAGRFSSLPRKVLVVVQFTVSVTLIIGTVIVYRQIQFTKNRPVGYNREGLVTVQITSPEFSKKYEALETELKNTGLVEEMSKSSSPVTDIWSNSSSIDWPGKDPALQADFATLKVSHDYGKTIRWNVKEGRDFSREYATDSNAVILNKAAIRFMNIKDPVGMEMSWGGEKLHVIGVVEDMIMDSPYKPVKQALYVINSKNPNWIEMRLNPDKSAAESLPQIEAIFKKHVTAPFDYKFIDDEYARKFSNEERIGQLASVFTVLAIIISCLGLFGLASFVAEQRIKEIGIRKVLGATVTNLWRMLSTDFVVLVLIACVIAAPIAYYSLAGWLKQYQYHTEISWWVFILTGVSVLVITLLTVSYQAIRTALMNPVRSLKSE